MPRIVALPPMTEDPADADEMAVHNASTGDTERMTLQKQKEWLNSLYTFTDYSATSTIVGWSSFTTKVITYFEIGKLIFLTFHIQGTSNSTNTTFSVPVAMKDRSQTLFWPLGYSRDNGTLLTALSDAYAVPASNSTIINVEKIPGGGWTASGTKGIGGTILYERV